MHRHAVLINSKRQTIVMDHDKATMTIVPFQTYMDETPDIMVHPVRGSLTVVTHCRYVAGAPFGREADAITINLESVMLMAQGGLTADDLHRILPFDDAERAWRDLMNGAAMWAGGLVQPQGTA